MTIIQTKLTDKTGNLNLEDNQNLKLKYPQRHNHYSLKDFFTFQTSTGTISDWNESRNILVSENFIIGLIAGLEEEVGDASGVVMYNIGREWGQEDAKFFKSWFLKEYGYEDFKKLNLLYVLEAWWWPFITQGWGNWEVDMSDQKNGFMFINIFDSAVARTLGDVGKPVCHIYAGLFAGFFSSLIKKELGCIEIQCYAMGETYCKFLLGKKDRIDAASFWHNEGATARDIEKKLHNGEYLK
ncbi:MAG: V4R domain-containing protein [Cyanobacteria bacterium P01_E01_bin.35]